MSSPLASSPAKGKPKGKGCHPHVESMPSPEPDEEVESSWEGELEEPGDEPHNNGTSIFFFLSISQSSIAQELVNQRGVQMRTSAHRNVHM